MHEIVLYSSVYKSQKFDMINDTKCQNIDYLTVSRELAEYYFEYYYEDVFWIRLILKSTDFE
jgi:hypothetical protein